MYKICKFLIPILIIAMFFCIIPKTEYAAETLKIGDINGDGIIDSRDTLRILEHIAASTIPQIKQNHSDWILVNEKLKCADINQDGVVDSRDTLRELEYIAASTVPTIEQKHSDWKTYIENKWEGMEATEIALDRTSIKLEEGKSTKLIATISPTNTTNKVVTWMSSDSKVVTVDGIGNVTGVKKGIAIITAKAPNGVYKTCQIEITDKDETVIDPTVTTLKSSNTKLTASTYSSNKNVTIKMATTENGVYTEKNLKKQPTVKPTRITLKQTDCTVPVGTTLKLNATIQPINTTNKTITWSSSNNNIAKVDKNGVVKGIKPGMITITATTSNGKKATCIIRVNIPPKSISLNKKSLSINKGSKNTLTVNFNPINTTSKEVNWKSSNANVVSVSNATTTNGNITITAKAKGTAIITATHKYGFKASCKVTVLEKINQQKQEIYDIVLFLGQSNMVGTAYNTIEKRYNHNIYTYAGANSVENYSKMTGINKNILNNNGQTLDFVSIKQTKNTAYEYMYLTNSFKEIDSTKKIQYGEDLVYENNRLIDYSKSSKKYKSLVKSHGTNMIPQFCQTYYRLTKHKVIAVFAAQGGVPIQTILPHGDKRNKLRKSNCYMYEALKTKYKAAEKLAKEKQLKIGNKLYIIAQGEANTEFNTSTNKYKEIYMAVHKNLKRDLGIKKGAIVETSYIPGNITMEQLNRVHIAQEEIIKKESDIILGSSYFYDRFVPIKSDYKNCNTKVTKGNNGKKLSYEEALLRARYSVDPTITNRATGKRNFIHFTSASLSQVGMEAAINISKVIK